MKYKSLLLSNNTTLDSATADLHANNASIAMEQKLNALMSRKNTLLLEKGSLESSIRPGDAESWVNRMHEISKNLKMVDVEIEIVNAIKKEWFTKQ